MKTLAASVLAVATLLAPLAARADTPMSRWDRAKNPAAYEDEKLHLSAHRLLVQLEIAKRLRSDLFDRFTRDLKISLEAWNAEKSADPRLRFDYGQLLEERGEHLRAIQVLKPALAMAPQHPAADAAWWFLGVACGHVGDYECEHRSYTELLRVRTEDYRRLTPMLNLAEVEMHLGRLKDAIADYQETLRVAARLPTDETTPLAQWGLAVAYDRAGDRAAAEREAARAIELERSMHRERLLQSQGVFFYPDYEVTWYEGLGAIARARAATSAHDAAIHWGEAERKFAAYVRGAEARKGGDPWLGTAKARHASAKAEREKAEKRRAKEPLPRRDDEELPL
jgi:tetratricopeptide (TPR) repeat protein